MFTITVLKKSLAMSSRSVATYAGYETLKVTHPRDNVYSIEINRPRVRNAMNLKMREEITDCFNRISTDKQCRSVVVSGDGKCFTAGLDLMDAAQIFNSDVSDVGRKAFALREHIKHFQNTFTTIEMCNKPVIVAIHGACIGAGIDMITACDIRYCTQDASFQVKEIDVGLAADVGTLQRLPRCIGSQSLVRELVYTCRPLLGEEALNCGLVSRLFTDKDTMVDAALDLAVTIAKKSPVAVQGSKVNLNYSQDHSVLDGLEYNATWNQAMLQSEDLMKAIQANMQKKIPIFSKL